MGADPVVYCLEQLTDYAQFERLCHDLMALEGYPDIEPLGGSQDSGRDAIHVSRSGERGPTIFAYSVRDDWRTKLKQDAESVKENGHACTRLIFLSTARYSATERDKAVAAIRDKFGWNLELYGLERLRILLSATHPQVVANHPHIFSSQFFPQAGGVSLVHCRDMVVIDNDEADDALACWLYRRLMLEGYRAWCQRLAPIGGESLADTLEALIKQRAFRLISVLSPSSVANPELSSRRTLASATAADLLLPVVGRDFNEGTLDAKMRQLERVDFSSSWADGLVSVLQLLAANNCPKTATKATVSSASFLQPDLILHEPELLVSNRFRVLDVPDAIRRFVGIVVGVKSMRTKTNGKGLDIEIEN